MAIEDLLGYLAKGALLIIDLTLVILIIGPFVIGYGIVIIFLNIVDTIRDHLPKHQPVYRLSKDDLKRIDWEMNLPVPKLGNTVVPVKKPDLPPSKPAKINLHDGFFYAKDLTEDQINMCKNNGYVEITTNPFGPGKGPRVLIKSPDNQSSIHYYFCRILKSEIEKYGHDALMYASVRPDIVANDIAFEVETGSHYRKKDLRDKFKRAKEGYSDYYILVTNRELREAYKPYGKVITRNEIKKTISRLYIIQPEF